MKEWIKPAAIVGGAALALVAAIVLSLVWMSSRPGAAGKRPVSQSDPSDMAKFVASDYFKKLPESEKRKYLDEMPKDEKTRLAIDSLDEATRKKLFDNMHSTFQAEMKRRVDEYFSLPQEKRGEWMDKFAAEEKERRSKMGPPPDAPKDADGKSQASSAGRPKGPPPASMIKNMLEKTTPESRAKFTTFMRELSARGAGPPPPPN